jgi:PAS domain S-box-containing protein
MVTEILIVRWLQGFGFVLSLLFAYYCVYNSERRGAMALSILFVGISIWISADIIQAFTPTQSLPAIGVPLRVLGPDITVIGLLLFALAYTGRQQYLSQRVFALLSVKPLVTLAIVFTPYRSALLQSATDSGVTVGYDLVLTPLFFAHVLYSWVFTVVSLALISLMMIQTRYGYQRQIVAVIVAISSPFIFNVTARLDILQYDLTSTGFLVTATVLTFAAFQLRLMDAVPVAQQAVLEQMRDMVFVTDENRQILFANSAAKEFFDWTDGVVGTKLASALGAEAVENIKLSARQEIQTSVAGERRHLDVDSSKIRDHRDNLLAEVLVCRDITNQKEREATLRQREEDLELLKDLQSRFLRHNLRNELNVVRANTELLANKEDVEERDRYETVIDKTDKILDWSKKAQTIEKLIGERTTLSYDLDDQLEQLISRLEQTYPDVEFDLQVTGGTRIEAVPQVESALENVIDNAARYNTPPEKSVRIVTEQSGETVTVRIEDNGPGISETEIATLEEGAEGPLKHSSGFGLWLVYWVVLKSGGDLSIETGDGTTVLLEFEAAQQSAPVEETTTSTPVE